MEEIERAKTMRSEDKVCTIDQAKKLVELRVELITELHWWDDKLRSIIPELKQFYVTDHESKNCFPAVDVAELGLLLPGGGWTVCSRKYTNDNSFLVEVDYIDDLDIKAFHGSSEAQAKTEALI